MNAKRISHLLGLILVLSLLIVPAGPARADGRIRSFDNRLQAGTALVPWNTFLGGIFDDHSEGIALDGSGNIYIVGASQYVSWGTPVNPFAGGEDAFVARLDGTGVLLWNTFLGGSGGDEGYGIALDASGNIYVTGTSWETWGTPVDPFFDSYFEDAFVAKLDNSGTLLWNTFLGGSRSDQGYGIALDGSGNIYITGGSYAAWGTPVNPYTSGSDAFVAKLDPGGALIWNTFLGGGSEDDGDSIAVDGSGNVYLTGHSWKTWGMPVDPHAGASDAFAARLDNSGALAWHTFLGGSGGDEGDGIALDGSGNVYITGLSFGAWGTPVNPYTGGYDAFVARLGSGGTLAWNTFLGRGAVDRGSSIALDGSGNIYITGESWSTGGQLDPVAGWSGAFIARFSGSGTLSWQTFLGGRNGNAGRGIAIGESGNVFIAGRSNATWGTPLRPFTIGQTYPGIYTYDAFAARVDTKVDVSRRVFRSAGAQDGWVLESSETSRMGGTLDAISPVFRLGDDSADRQYRAILSFNTGGLPDGAVITRAMLRIREHSVTGTYPHTTTHGALKVDIRKPYFGTTGSLAINDFQAAGIPTVATAEFIPPSGWVPVFLDAPAHPYINLTGLTQFRLRFAKDDNDDQDADYLKYYSGNAATGINRPLLLIEYYVP